MGTIGLIKAVDSFDIERNVRFSTYAAKCIDNEILMLFGRIKRKEREVSLNEPIGKDKEGNEISLKTLSVRIRRRNSRMLWKIICFMSRLSVYMVI